MNSPRINQFQCNPQASAPRLLIKPGVLVLCTAGTCQLRAYLVDDDGETLVDAGISFTSSDAAVATVGAGTGLVTCVAAGNCVIEAAYGDYRAYAFVAPSVPAAETDCGSDQPVATVLIVDRSRSMLVVMNDGLPTLLDYAKAIALELASGLNTAKDVMGVLEFDDLASIKSSLSATNASVIAAIDGISISSEPVELTYFDHALVAAMNMVNGCLACKKHVVVLITDGIALPELGTQDTADLLAEMEAFKSAGGIVLCVGLKASGSGYRLLRNLATDGYFVNCIGSGSQTITDTKQAVLDLSGYYTAGTAPSEPPGAQNPFIA